MNVQLHRMHTKRTRSKNYATKLCITLLKQHAVDKFCIISKYGTEIRWTRFLQWCHFYACFLFSAAPKQMSENSFGNQYLYGKRDANNKNNMLFFDATTLSVRISLSASFLDLALLCMWMFVVRIWASLGRSFLQLILSICTVGDGR